MIRSEDAESTDTATRKTPTTVAARDVVARKPSPVSPMPMGLPSTLELEQILDLVAYIESGGNPNHPAFAE